MELDSGRVSAPVLAPTGSPVRIGDAERDDAVASLGDHFAAGRLNREELDERIDRAIQARFDADLEPLFADLPSPIRADLPAPSLRSAIRRPGGLATRFSGWHPSSSWRRWWARSR